MEHEIIAALKEAEKLMKAHQDRASGRDMAIALTNLQTAMLWAERALNPPA